MLKGLELPELVERVNQAHAAKRDFACVTSAVQMFGRSDCEPMITGLAERPMMLNVTAQRQLAEWMNMGFRYWQQCWSEAPALLAANVNHWFQERDERRLFRAFDYQDDAPRLRAFLSDRYQRADNIDLLQTVAPVLGSIPGLRWEASYLTDDRLYLKVFNPGATIQPKVGDVLMTGLMIRNEETGLGSTLVVPMSLRLTCLNGAVHNEYGSRIVHVKRAGQYAGAEDCWSDTTKAITDAAIQAQIKDTVLNILQGQWAKRVEEQMAKAMGVRLSNPVKDAEKLLTNLELPKADQELVISQFFGEGDASMYGLFNAVTRVAHASIDDFERSTELETLGGKLLSMVR